MVSENTLAFSVLSGAQRGVNICYSFVLSECKRNKGRKVEGRGREGKREGRRERRRKGGKEGKEGGKKGEKKEKAVTSACLRVT